MSGADPDRRLRGGPARSQPVHDAGGVFTWMVRSADWRTGVGHLGVWSVRSLAREIGWTQPRTGRLMRLLVARGMVRLEPHSAGSRVIILQEKGDFSGETRKAPQRNDFERSVRISRLIIARHYDRAESAIANMLSTRPRHRGRPRRNETDQWLFSIWLYLLTTSGGHTVQEVAGRLGLHRKAITATADRIADMRDSDPQIDRDITNMESAFHAALVIINMEMGQLQQAEGDVTKAGKRPDNGGAGR